MDTEAMRWFQLVADGLTVTDVAAIHSVSQPHVSRALARLEAEVGTALLRRSGRVLRLTHAGMAFKAHVDRVVHELDDALGFSGRCFVHATRQDFFTGSAFTQQEDSRTTIGYFFDGATYAQHLGIACQ